MKLRVKMALCIALAVFAALSLAAVLGSIGVIPVSSGSGDYLLRAVDGYVAVFHPADGEEPAEITDIRVADLPAGDRQALLSGVSVTDRTALMRLLEDYGA